MANGTEREVKMKDLAAEGKNPDRRLGRAEPGRSEEQSEKRAVAFLSGEPVLHADMLGCLRRGSARVLAASGSGVLLLDGPSGVHMFSAADETAARRMLSGLEQVELLVAHGECGADFAKAAFGFSGGMQVCNAVYPRRKPLPETERPAEIRRLDESFLPFMRAHYDGVPEEDYLRGRLKAGAVFGAFAGGEPAGFIGMHEEGSMGMLEVLPRFRRRGIARMLETFLANRLLRSGRVPYAQIRAGNGPSAALHRELGFLLSEFSIRWLTR
jgi:tRNA (guanine37-N1)-methyltransferase